MGRRICDACVKEKDIHRGKICANGHFIFTEYVYISEVLQQLFRLTQTLCSLCGKPLRLKAVGDKKVVLCPRLHLIMDIRLRTAPPKCAA